MSYDNNNNYYDDDFTNSQWQGSTWNPESKEPVNDDSNSFGFNSSEFGYNYIKEPVTAGKVLATHFEENVLAQSFAFMFVALLITAFTAYYVVSSPVIFNKIFYTPGTIMILCVAELVIVMVSNFALARNAVIPSAILFTLYSVINGATLSSIFVIYDLGTIYTTFAVCAVMFGVMSVYGLVTKKDLTSVGCLCLTALVGLIVATLVNMFIGSSFIDMVISVAGIVIFVGIVAFDTQKIKDLINYTNTDNITCIALMGALELYLDFINLFLRLLRIFGRQRD